VPRTGGVICAGAADGASAMPTSSTATGSRRRLDVRSGSLKRFMASTLLLNHRCRFSGRSEVRRSPCKALAHRFGLRQSGIGFASYASGLDSRQPGGSAQNTRVPMTIGSICNRQVVVSPRSESIVDAAKRMRMLHVGTVVVVAERDG